MKKTNVLLMKLKKVVRTSIIKIILGVFFLFITGTCFAQSGCYSLLFGNSTNSYVSSSVPYTTNYTIQAWIKTSATSAADCAEIVGWGSTSTTNTNNIQFRMGFTGTTGYLQYGADIGGWGSAITGTTAINNNAWHNVAIVKSGSTVTIYVDGVSNGSNTDSRTPNVNILEIGNYMKMGVTQTNAFFKGNIDEVRIWNTALSSSQLTNAVMNTKLAGNETGLVAYYTMDQGTGTTTLTDNSVNGYTGTLGGTTKPTFTATYATYEYISSQSTAAQTKCQGVSFTAISVTAGGSATKTYQWYSNTTASNIGGTLLSGATSSSYTPLSTTVGTLYYYCVVSTTNCSVTSAVSGAFIVNPTTAISSQNTPAQTQCQGGTFTPISVTATGAGLSYQWYSNTSASTTGGTLISGATSSSYTPQNTTAGTLYYYCIASGCGTATSAISGATVVNPLPTISSQSTATQTQCQGGTFSPISVSATGSNLGYQWYSNTSASTTGGSILSEATNSSYTPPATTVGTLYYYCIVSISSCSATSSVSGAFIVNGTTSATVLPATQAICPGGTTTPATVTINNTVTATLINSTLASAPANTFITGNAAYLNGSLHITENVASQLGGFYVSNPNSYNTSQFTASFQQSIYNSGGNYADGMSFNYGGDIANPAVNGCEQGSGTGLSICEETYSGNGGPYISAKFNGVNLSGNISTSAIESSGFVTIVITVNSSNQLTVSVGGTTLINVALPAAYASANKSSWIYNISARTGGSYEQTYIQNLSITYPEEYQYSFNGGSTYQSTNSYTPPSTAASYNVYIKTLSGICPTSIGSTSVTLLPTTSISSSSPATQSTCISGSFNPISVIANGTGTLTYQWFSNTHASTIGGTTLTGNGATTSSYTPQVAANGTLYYYCTVHGSCGSDQTSPISEAFNINPVAQPTQLQLVPDLTFINGSFTASAGADHYLIVRSTTSTFGSTLPLNGTTYVAGDVTSFPGDTVVSYTNSTTFTDNGLNPLTVYYYYVFAVNETCTGLPSYLTTSPLTGYASTLSNIPCTTPADPSGSITLTPAATTMGGTFAAVSPAPDYYLIIRSTASSLSTAPFTTTYADGSSLGGGTVVAYQSGTSFTDVNLTPGTLYYYFVYSANAICMGGPYYSANSISNNAYTYCVSPLTQPTGLTFTTTPTTISGSYTASANANHYLIVRSTSSSLNATPANGTTYTNGTPLGEGTVIAYQTGTSFSDIGPLTSATLYYYYVFASNLSGCTNGPIYFATSPLTNNTYTGCSYPANQPTALVLTPNSSAITGSFTASNGTPSADHYLIVRSASSNPTTPLNGITYSAGQIISGINNDTVVAYQTGTSFNDNNNISLSNTYYYYVYAVNNTNCSGGPVYTVASPLSGSASTFPPVITSLGSSTGCVGGILTINGTSLSGALTVSVGGISVTSFTVHSPSLITAMIGTASNGTVAVSTLIGTATSTSSYTATVNNPYTTTPILSGSTIICPGGSTNLTFNVGNSAGPFTLTYLPSGGTNTVVSALYNGSTFSVSPTATTNYQLINVIDAKGCISTGDLIVNPSGDLGTATGWTFTGTWATENTPVNFVTTYTSAYKSQIIDLVAAGYSTTELDEQPYIYVSDEFSTRADAAGWYGLLTQLRNSASASVTSWSNPSTYTTPGTPGYTNLGNNVPWTTTSNIFSNYGTGVRYVYFEDASYSVPVWGGTYGTKLRNSTVKVCPVVTVGTTAINSQSTATQTTCLNGTFTPISVTATGINITYQWYSNTAASTSGGTSLGSFNGAETNTYTPQATTVGTLYYYCVVTGCGTNVSSAISGAFNVITPSVGGTATATTSSLCNGSSTTITLTGYTGTIEWQQSSDNLNWSIAIGGSGATTDTYTTPDLTTTTYYRAYVTSGVCSATNSTSAMVTVNNLSVGGTATATNPLICYNGNTSITLTAYNGTIQWEQSADGNTNWTNVTGGSGATTASLTTPNITVTTYFRAVVTSGACSSANSTIATVSFPYPVTQPSNIILASGTTTVSGSFIASEADHYLIVRSTLSSLSVAPLNGTTYNTNDPLGGGVVVSYQTGTNISDINLNMNTPYYYYIFAANVLSCTDGPVYLTAAPLTGTITTLLPQTKTLKITAMLQEYFNSTTGLMNQTLGLNWDTGDLYKNFPGTIVDTLMVLIRKTNITADVVSSFPIDTVFYGVNLNNNGLITISLSAGITGYHYIEIKHRNSIETWSDSVDFSTDTIRYD
ncbi:MAG: LamG-like jellyroll fold domain-containing protein, partial [Bacteroidota bacterium]